MKPTGQEAANGQTREAWLSADNEELIPEKMLDEIADGDAEQDPEAGEDNGGKTAQ